MPCPEAPAACTACTILSTALRLRNGSVEPEGVLTTYIVQSFDPVETRVAASRRRSLIVSSWASGSGMTACTSSSRRPWCRYGAMRILASNIVQELSEQLSCLGRVLLRRGIEMTAKDVDQLLEGERGHHRG